MSEFNAQLMVKLETMDAEITRLQKELDTARGSGTLEIDDGCVIWRDGPTSITICAETVTIFDSESGEPAVKVPLTQDDVFRALAGGRE